jgi:polyketide cyclase/dehydrase/lipid transport protein
MRTVLILVGVLVGLMLLVVLVGWLLPVGHRATREATLRVSPARLFALLTTPADFPKWRTGVKSIELLPRETGGPQQFREVSGYGTILYTITRALPDRELVTQIADRNLPYGGGWTCEIIPVGADSATLRVTENGEIYNPLFRFVSRFILGYHSSLDRYLRDVGKHFAQEVAPR